MEVSDINACKYTAGITGSQKNIKVTATDSKEYWIPMDNTNNDYKVVLAWVEAGNTIAEAVS